MKLRKLNAQIDASPKIKGMTRWGLVNVEKGDFKRALKEHFKDGNAETGLLINEEGVVCVDAGGSDGE